MGKKKKKSKRTLNPKQKKFAREYLKDSNATQAAIRAGYSKNTAGAQGHALLKILEIQAIITKANKKQAKKVSVTVERVIKELSFIAFSDPKACFDKDGELLPIHKMPEGARRAMAGFDMKVVNTDYGDESTTVETLKKYKNYDKIKALELLGKYLQMFIDKVELGTEDGKPLEITIINQV